jgi:uncharacterized membrane protein YdjX (TVP38/TMEM64 family)
VLEGIFANLETWLAAIGVWAYVVAPLVMATVSILPIPAEAPALINGMIFGPAAGTLITWSGAMLGAWISYEIARGWGRPLARRMVSEAAVAKIDQVAEKAGWGGLLALRFIPVVAFTALNWGAGLCAVPRWRFLWTTALGILPGAIVFTSSGMALVALWRQSPRLTAILTAVLLVVSLMWIRRRRHREAVG